MEGGRGSLPNLGGLGICCIRETSWLFGDYTAHMAVSNIVVIQRDRGVHNSMQYTAQSQAHLRQLLRISTS
jgi:hypothetical protein